MYRARDTRLDRTVAIKVLPEHVAADADLKQRFEREARTVAALNHPHICTLHDIGSQDGIDFLVMEYLDGQTLAQRLEKGAVPLDQALTIAIEIADALDRAHRQGIVHRDLKPGNIMLTKAGAKLLDFGLAKLRKPGTVGATGFSAAAAATQTETLTGLGTILGTLQYMAPEQLEGKEADPRTDIFAYGAVLYEMLTSEKAFHGESQASLIAAIMHVEAPAPSATQPGTPPALDYVVQTCLAKDPDDRWHSAGDVKRQLRWIVGGSGSQPSVSVPVGSLGQPMGWRRTLPWVGGIVAAGVLAGLAVWGVTRSTPAPRSPVQLALTLPPGERLYASGTVAISPDGQRIAYIGGDGRLQVRTLSERSPITLVAEGARDPFFSPDSEWIGFRGFGAAQSDLSRVSVHGGPPVLICDPPPGGLGILVWASWAADDTIIFATEVPSGLWRVSAGGGEPEEFTTPNHERGEVNHSWPEVLPGGHSVLFTIEGAEGSQIGVFTPETGEQAILVQRGSSPRYAPTGHIIYSVAGTLRAVGFDLDRLEVTTSPVPVVDAVHTYGAGANFSLAANGSLVYVPSTPVPLRRLVWVDRAGREEVLEAEPRVYDNPRVSPDGRRIAVQVDDPGNSDVFIYDIERRTLTQLTFAPERDWIPLWSPAGDAVLFRSDREGGGVFRKAADGTGEVELLTTETTYGLPFSWSQDGILVLYGNSAGSGSNDILTLSLESGRQSFQPLIPGPSTEEHPSVSPDGQWIAYASLESGQFEVVVRPYPNVDDGRWQISTDGGSEPVWGAEGRELFYPGRPDISGGLEGATRMMVATMGEEPPFPHGAPRMLFGGDYVFPGSGRHYDLAPDGRFLMLKSVADGAAPQQINVVLDWFEELKALVPVD